MTIKAKWNGGKEDPDQITQYGVVFEKGEWTDLPEKFAPNLVAKLKGNKYFEVDGAAPPAKPTPKA